LCKITKQVLRELVHRPVQTNEVGRCAALLGGFLEVARHTGLPLRLLEVGAAGGLILRWDQYRYEAGHEGWGNSHSRVRITGVFGAEHPRFDVLAKIVERRGCDASPIDPGTEEGRLTLQSYVWPDQVERFRQLVAAIDVARRVSAHVEQGNAPDWVETALAPLAKAGVPTQMITGHSLRCGLNAPHALHSPLLREWPAKQKTCSDDPSVGEFQLGATAVPFRLSLQLDRQESRHGELRAVYLHIFIYFKDGSRLAFPSRVRWLPINHPLTN
jgi:hypothetical protein